MPTTPPKTPKRGSPGKGRNIWNHEQRLCLDILFGHPHKATPSERVQRALVFNSIFKDHQVTCGVHGGLTYSILSTQYYESIKRHNSTWVKNWGSICAVPKQDTDLRERLRDMIDQVLMSGDTIQVSAGPATPPATPLDRNETSHSTSGTKPTRFREDQLATPGPSTRKRSATTSEVPLVFDDNEQDEDFQPGPKRPRTRRSPVVELPAVPPPITASVSVSVTKSGKSPRRPRVVGRGRPGANYEYIRFDGSTIWLYYHEWLETQQPLNTVSEAAAHPATGPALVYRYWDDKSHGLNSPDGFLAGRSVGALVHPEAPPATDVLSWNDFARHLNNAGFDQTGAPSPWISTSSLLIWCMGMALRKSDPTGRVSVIDPSKLLHERAMFYVPPFYEELKKKRCFTRGGFQYQGTYEHLIWDRVPGAAIVKTFSIVDLITLAESSPTLKAVLRLEKLKASAANIAKKLKADKLYIDAPVAGAIAQIVMFLGFSHISSLEALVYAVTQVVQGWWLQADGDSQAQVRAFVHAFCRMSDSHVELADHLKLMQAFYTGLQWTYGERSIRKQNPEAYEKMKRLNAKKHMVAPAEVIAQTLDSLKLNAVMYEAAQDRLHAAPLVIDGGGTVEEIAADEEEEEEDEAILYDEEVVGRQCVDLLPRLAFLF